MPAFMSKGTPSAQIAEQICAMCLKHPEWTTGDFLVAMAAVNNILLAQLPYATHLETMEKLREILRNEFDKRVS